METIVHHVDVAHQPVTCRCGQTWDPIKGQCTESTPVAVVQFSTVHDLFAHVIMQLGGKNGDYVQAAIKTLKRVELVPQHFSVAQEVPAASLLLLVTLGSMLEQTQARIDAKNDAKDKEIKSAGMPVDPEAIGPKPIELSQAEALYAFAAYLSGVGRGFSVGAYFSTSDLWYHVNRFCRAQEFLNVRPDWQLNVRPYPPQ